MVNNKRGQIVAFVIIVVMFIAMWALFLGKFLSYVGKVTVETNNITGIEGFVLSNLNLFVFIALVCGLIAYGFLGGGNK
jgi:hypothetical protein